ncbi:MAG: hypothetical protein A2W90_14420 [Bacteroidetes bacterium GWF2_42_66]|nr:MAG: hypothetical protein A2W92_15815 [Bacteroidetes bacterium GWA2_42_15]OFX99110.1 MAG: hypothetical protein A2W89_06840 [Bacteroidetes bacterium GWE2_42_39]OFY46721.1 MAG: hypothetical protein A2W90_14420 [Bacteroidetes bacterium GWF2_42_66]HAZ00667.1 hypothetical protein [Marinilabiliales bacterium]HBL73873.1 hypothetical protein [Prolixibacteraceae bacterium]
MPEIVFTPPSCFVFLLKRIKYVGRAIEKREVVYLSEEKTLGAKNRQIRLIGRWFIFQKAGK